MFIAIFPNQWAVRKPAGVNIDFVQLFLLPDALFLRFSSSISIPFVSSCASFVISSPRPIADNTEAYMPIDTVGLPFSTCHTVDRLILARLATSSTERFRLSLAFFIWLPTVARFCDTLGYIITPDRFDINSPLYIICNVLYNRYYSI